MSGFGKFWGDRMKDIHNIFSFSGAFIWQRIEVVSLESSRTL